MKKLVLVGLLGIFGFVAKANNCIVTNNILPAPCDAYVTIQFVEHDFVTCANNGLSPVYPGNSGIVYNLDKQITWGSTPLLSYQLYGVIVCLTCPGLPAICLPEIFVMPTPCGPTMAGPVITPCCGPFAADITAGGGGGVNYTLNIHP